MRLILLFVLTFGATAGYAQVPAEYLETAAKNNPGLRAKYTEFEAALRKAPQADALPDPVLSFGYFVSPAETRLGPQRAKFSLTQMFPWFGTLKAQGNAAALTAEARHQAFLDARNKLYYRVAAAYYSLYELNRLEQIERKNADILRSYKAIANSKFKSGASPMVDVLRVDIMLKDAVTELEILGLKEKPLLSAFNALLDREDDAAVEISDSPGVIKPPENLPKDTLLAENPLLKELEFKVKAAESARIAARRHGYPRLGLGLDYVVVGRRTDMDPPDNGKDILMPMVSLSLPLFRGKYKASVEEARLTREAYSLRKKEYANSLQSGYEMAWFEVRRQLELIRLHTLQIRETERALDLLFSAYGNSGREFEEVLRMQQLLLKHEKMKATAEAGYLTAAAQLDYLTARTLK
ncbi:MAG: TolC family protein [Elusimicrobiales bacterium]|nr:TolC family protein [Elusimicrobiales bacterium]